MPHLGGRPVVRWAAEITDHYILLPLDSSIRILMLMPQTDRMAKLVSDGSSIHEAQVHGRLVLRDLPAVGADV